MITWEFRTFCGLARIKQFLDHRLGIANPTAFDWTTLKLLPEIGWIESIFTFEVGGFGLGSGVFRLIPTPDGRWKGYTRHTSLTGLKDYLEKTGKEPPSRTMGDSWNNESVKWSSWTRTSREINFFAEAFVIPVHHPQRRRMVPSLDTLRVQRSLFDWHGCGCGITRYNVGKMF